MIKLDKKSLRDIKNGGLIYIPNVVKKTNANAGLLHGYLLTKAIIEDAKFGDWIPITTKELERETTMKQYKIRTALKRLEVEGFVVTKIMGMPAKRFVRLLDFEV